MTVKRKKGILCVVKNTLSSLGLSLLLPQVNIFLSSTKGQ